jgi:hypothetical protein
VFLRIEVRHNDHHAFRRPSIPSLESGGRPAPRCVDTLSQTLPQTSTPGVQDRRKLMEWSRSVESGADKKGQHVMNQDIGHDVLCEVDLNLPPNEASGLLATENDALLEAHGWDSALWTLLGEGEIQDCIALLGHERGASTSEGWQIEHLDAQLKDDSVKTEDAEAIARYDGWVYIFGSHFGGKSGPLEPKRGFVARFREADVQHAADDPPVDIEVFRESFVLHRLINDALKARGRATVSLAREGYELFIDKTRRLGREEIKEWEDLIHGDDLPLNVEGAAFRPDGRLLLGLRFPVADDGRPMLVELEGIERVFEPDDRLPEVKGFWVVDAIGQGGDMAGVRDLNAVGDELHLLTGNVDGRDQESVLVEDYYRGHEVETTHFRCTLPPNTQPAFIEATFVRRFPGILRVEGIAAAGGRFFYVVDDEERIPLLLTYRPADLQRMR